ncbi:MAG: hypothetical protein ICV72_09605 [Aldersonia sp.]|nr:hypothetical protein [Aldersonia sp.]
MATQVENPNVIPRSAMVMLIVLMLLPGAFFVGKGLIELIDRFAPQATAEATITSVVQREQSSGTRWVTVYEVNGIGANGEEFTFEDHRVFDLADGKTPLPVVVDRSALTDRIVTLRAGSTTIQRVGGATALWLALVAVAVGLALSVLPALMAWQTDARKQAKRDGTPPPRPDLGALALVVASALLTIGGVFAWDLLR